MLKYQAFSNGQYKIRSEVRQFVWYNVSEFDLIIILYYTIILLL